MKLIQITDLHVGKIGDDSYGVDVRQNFLDVLEAVKAEKPDRIVISGDLCLHDGEPEVYEWLKEHLDKAGFPYDIISGNHDDATQIAECFGLNEFLTDGQLFFKKNYDSQTFLFLDTTDYTLPKTQLIWLEKELKNLDEELIIFIHHPPVKSGVPFMDNKYFLQNMDAVQEVLFKYLHPVHLFCGHYHVDKVIKKKNLTVYITPAVYFQIDDRTTDFNIDHYRIGFREINLDSGTIITTVRYLDGNKL